MLLKAGGLAGAMLAIGAIGAAEALAALVVPATAAPGATVTLQARGLVDPKVTVAGRRARVVSASKSAVRFVVPGVDAGRRPVVARSGRRTARGRLRVPSPFTGKVGIRADARRSRSATIGPDGGRLVARRRGTSFTLTVPAGALSIPTRITMAPVKAYRGLPFAARGSGVSLKPDGLSFAMPATLTIALRRPAPRRLAGFGLNGAGRAFEVRDAPGSRRRVRVALPHFSSAGAAPASEADFAAAVAPLIAGLGTLTRSQISQIIALRDQFEHLFPGFCERQAAICDEVGERAIASLNRLIIRACGTYSRVPAYGGIPLLQELEANRRLLGAPNDGTADSCMDTLLRALVADAVARLAVRDPLESSGAESDLTATERSRADLDRDGSVNWIEWGIFLAAAGQELQVQDAANDALNAALEGLTRVREEGLAKCDTDEAAGEQRLRAGHAIAAALPYEVAEFEDAIAGCHVHVQMSPAAATVAVDESKQFVATLTNDNDSGVTWSASGGSVSADGLYVPPNTTGAYTVTATSNLNPRRAATATVQVTCAPEGPQPARHRAMTEAEADQCLATGSVALHQRHSIVSSIASAGIDQDGGNLEFFEFGDWAPATLTASASSDSGTASSSTSHVSSATLDAGNLIAAANIDLSGSVTGTASSGFAGSRHKIDFEVLAEGVAYTLTGSIDAPAAGKGLAYVRLYEPGDPDLFKTSAATLSESGTLPAGDYTLIFEIDLEAEDSETLTGGIDATFSTSG